MNKPQLKEINIDTYVNEDITNVKKLIARNETDEGTIDTGYESHNIYDLVKNILAEGTRVDENHIKYFDIIEKAVSVFKNASFQLRVNMDLDTLEDRYKSFNASILQRKQAQLAEIIGNNELMPGSGDLLDANENISVESLKEAAKLNKHLADGRFFSNRYALYFAGKIGLSLLKAEKLKSAEHDIFTFGPNHDTSVDESYLSIILKDQIGLSFKGLSKDLLDKKEELSEQTLKDTLEVTFNSWINQFNWDSYKDIVDRFDLDKLKLKYENFSLNKDEFKQKYDIIKVDHRIKPVKKEDIIGGQYFGKVIWDSCMKLAGYRHESRHNILNPPRNIFAFGHPGCGKTFGAHAYLQSFAQLCKEKGVPLWIFTHSVTDYASKYQNESANQLMQIVEDINDFPGMVIMYVADADTIFKSRAKSDASSEANQVTGIYLKMFDGTMIHDKGKFMSIMDANFIDNIDPAQRSRLFDRIIELKRFDKADQFAEYVKRSVTKDIDFDPLSKRDWNKVGKYLLNTELSNRNITSVINTIMGQYEVPEEIAFGPQENQRKYVNKELKKVLSVNNMIDQFQNYIDTELDIQRASDAKKMQEQYDIFESEVQKEHKKESKTQSE